MDRSVLFILTTSRTPETKSDIITHAIDNSMNKSEAKLSQMNQHLLGFDVANLFVDRHINELQRCSQFYSLASIFNETSTNNKHYTKRNNIKKKYSAARKYFIRLSGCFL